MKIKHIIFGLIIGVSMAVAGSISAVMVFGPQGFIDIPQNDQAPSNVPPQAEDDPITDQIAPYSVTPPPASPQTITAQEARLRSIEARLKVLEDKNK